MEKSYSVIGIMAIACLVISFVLARKERKIKQIGVEDYRKIMRSEEK